jgi:hypothetical protein
MFCCASAALVRWRTYSHLLLPTTHVFIPLMVPTPHVFILPFVSTTSLTFFPGYTLPFSPTASDKHTIAGEMRDKTLMNSAHYHTQIFFDKMIHVQPPRQPHTHTQTHTRSHTYMRKHPHTYTDMLERTANRCATCSRMRTPLRHVLPHAHGPGSRPPCWRGRGFTRFFFDTWFRSVEVTPCDALRLFRDSLRRGPTQWRVKWHVCWYAHVCVSGIN